MKTGGEQTCQDQNAEDHRKSAKWKIRENCLKRLMSLHVLKDYKIHCIVGV